MFSQIMRGFLRPIPTKREEIARAPSFVQVAGWQQPLVDWQAGGRNLSKLKDSDMVQL